MAKIVVDTNIVFSAILNIDGNIAKILLSTSNKYDFYSCHFLKEEIFTHKSKILKLTGFSEREFLEIEYLITKNIHFVHSEIIPLKTQKRALTLCTDIDIKDSPFIALTLHLKSKLWTGDKKLINGLSKKGFQNMVTTNELK